MARRGLAAATAALLLPWPAQAQSPAPVGDAVTIQKDVRGELPGRNGPIQQGDQVFRNEWVRTAAESLAKVMLLDQTSMVVGPSSQVRLDRFVYAGNTATEVVTNVVKGTFRFVSGASPHEAYQVNTPQATIGVRGTTYDVRVLGSRTEVVVIEGAVTVCLRGSQRCVTLDQPGQSASATRTALRGPLAPNATPWHFGQVCGPYNASLCDPAPRQVVVEAPQRSSPPEILAVVPLLLPLLAFALLHRRHDGGTAFPTQNGSVTAPIGGGGPNVP